MNEKNGYLCYFVYVLVFFVLIFVLSDIVDLVIVVKRKDIKNFIKAGIKVVEVIKDYLEGIVKVNDIDVDKVVNKEVQVDSYEVNIVLNSQDYN